MGKLSLAMMRSFLTPDIFTAIRATAADDVVGWMSYVPKYKQQWYVVKVRREKTRMLVEATMIAWWTCGKI